MWAYGYVLEIGQLVIELGYLSFCTACYREEWTETVSCLLIEGIGQMANCLDEMPDDALKGVSGRCFKVH